MRNPSPSSPSRSSRDTAPRDALRASAASSRARRAASSSAQTPASIANGSDSRQRARRTGGHLTERQDADQPSLAPRRQVVGAKAERRLQDVAPAVQMEERARGLASTKRPTPRGVPRTPLPACRETRGASPASQRERAVVQRRSAHVSPIPHTQCCRCVQDRRSRITSPGFHREGVGVDDVADRREGELAEQPPQRAVRCGAGWCTGGSATRRRRADAAGRRRAPTDARRPWPARRRGG